MVRLTDRQDMTLDVYNGRRTIKQQQQQIDCIDFNTRCVGCNSSVPIAGFFYCKESGAHCNYYVVVSVLLFYAHGKHLRSCRDGRLT